MHLDRYEYSTNATFLDYEFCSDGPKGKIKKIISFVPQNANGKTYFKVAFGDLNQDQLDDQVISDNQDRNKILATVAAAILEFTNKFPDMMVYAQGSTPARTRLCQMGIAFNWAEMEGVLNVYGYINDQWEPFCKKVNYDAFLVIPKKSNFMRINLALMPSENNNKEPKKSINAIISDKVRSYANDPFVLKKAKQSKEFLEKHPFPKELLDKR